MLIHAHFRVPATFGPGSHPLKPMVRLLLGTLLSLVTFVIALALALSVSAAPLEDVPQTIVQPDGEELHVFATGDEFYHWLHDQNGYVIVQNAETGFFVYAIEKAGDIVPSQYVAGKVDPGQVGLKPNIRPSPEVYQQRRSALRPAA
ncbi:MAG: hypothetical protein Q7T04_02360, partial [Dehalococcoidia bacterium]|nr:hypothetical protein [Dehalococcoidia bacterium]